MIKEKLNPGHKLILKGVNMWNLILMLIYFLVQRFSLISQTSKVRSDSVVEDATVDVETTSDDVIPADISLPSQFLLPNLGDSSSNEETEVTELYTEVEPTINNSGKEMQSINSEADSLVNTKELLEFIDTMDVRDASKVTDSDTQEESVHDVTRQDDSRSKV